MPKQYCMLFDSVRKQQFPTFCSFFIFCFWLAVLKVPAREMENCVSTNKVG